MKKYLHYDHEEVIEEEEDRVEEEIWEKILSCQLIT